MKITKRQLKRIIKEERARILSESPMRLNSLATKEFAQVVKGKTAISEASEYDAQEEIYAITQHLSDAAMKLAEFAYQLRRSDARKSLQFDSMARQVEKIQDTVETHIKGIEDSARGTNQPTLDSGDIV